MFKSHQTYPNRLKALLTATAGCCFALPSFGESPYTEPDNSYVSLTGDVVSAEADSFLLNYGEGIVTVEMDDWDSYGDAYAIMENDDVTVYGYVDDDFYETTTIEASSVFVENLNTYFYASGADEETTATVAAGFYDYDYEVTGTVTEVMGREFTLDTGNRQIRVDTLSLGYNPMDDNGFIKIEEGDRITVFGDLDLSLFDEREIAAESVVELLDS